MQDAKEFDVRSSKVHPAALRALCLTLMCITIWIPAQASEDAASEPVVRATLANGLRVVIVRDTLAPVAAISLNYLVGADESPTGYPGMAHAQEHMMFRGSPGLSSDQLAEIGSLMGGDFNADTRQDVTQYVYTVPANDLSVALHVEAARMAGVLDTSADWRQERGAIEQEVAQDMSDPQYVLQARMRAALFAGTPYAHDGLGTRQSFDRTTASMLRDFHDRWYAPNNAVLVIVGDVDGQTTLDTVRQLFGPIGARDIPPRPDVRLQAVAPGRIRLPSDLPYGVKVLSMRLPGRDSPDEPALEILADVLNSPRGALYALVPEGKALSAGFDFYPLRKAAIGAATVTFAAGDDGSRLENEVRGVLAGIARDGVPATLVAAAKLQERAAAGFAKNATAGLANSWSEAVAVDGMSSPAENTARLESVTVADVDRVARKYLDPRHAWVGELLPAASPQPVSRGGFSRPETIALGTPRVTPLPDWAQSILGRLSVPASRVHPFVTRLANGLTLIVQPEPASDTVSVYGHIRNEPALETPAGQEGLSTVLDQLFSYGSRGLHRIAFQRELDAIGADEQAGADFSLNVLKEDFDRGTELLADNELHPALPETAFEVVRRQVGQTIAGRLKSPGYRGQMALGSALFPKGDPSLRQPLPQTVNALSLEQVRNYYETTFRPDLAVIVVVGNVTSRQAEAVFAKYFGAWSAAGPAPRTTLPPVPQNPPSATLVPDASRVQDAVTLAQTMAVDSSNPDRYALTLGNAVLGGGFYSSRLSRDLRKNAGLVYSVDTRLDVDRTRGIYLIEYACAARNVAKIRSAIEREVKTMRTLPASPEELQQAKQMLLGRLPLAEDSMAGIAQGLIARWNLQLPLDEPTVAAGHILNLNAEDVQHTFAKLLRTHGFAQVAIGPRTM